MRILFAEDEISLAKAVVRILEKNNYYFVDELLPTIDFLTDAERTIITTIANCKSKEREEKDSRI